MSHAPGMHSPRRPPRRIPPHLPEASPNLITSDVDFPRSQILSFCNVPWKLSYHRPLAAFAWPPHLTDPIYKDSEWKHSYKG